MSTATSQYPPKIQARSNPLSRRFRWLRRSAGRVLPLRSACHLPQVRSKARFRRTPTGPSCIPAWAPSRLMRLISPISIPPRLLWRWPFHIVQRGWRSLVAGPTQSTPSRPQPVPGSTTPINSSQTTVQPSWVAACCPRTRMSGSKPRVIPMQIPALNRLRPVSG